MWCEYWVVLLVEEAGIVDEKKRQTIHNAQTVR